MVSSGIQSFGASIHGGFSSQMMGGFTEFIGKSTLETMGASMIKGEGSTDQVPRQRWAPKALDVFPHKFLTLCMYACMNVSMFSIYLCISVCLLASLCPCVCTCLYGCLFSRESICLVGPQEVSIKGNWASFPSSTILSVSNCARQTSIFRSGSSHQVIH